MAEAYLDPALAPEAVAPACGLDAGDIRRLAALLAHTAFERGDHASTAPGPTSAARRHETMTGRPVAFHAMRGISAHANGFQTCRAIHLLQILLGAVETPGSFRFKPPYPKPVAAHPKPHHKVTPGKPLDGPHLGYPRGPEDLAIDADGRPKRIDKAFSWEAPLAAHGMMHMVIANAVAGDPYPIEVLFLYMANMAWNSAMNTAETMDMLTATDASGEYLIPKIIVADAYASETTAYADLVLPDTTYLERHDCLEPPRPPDLRARRRPGRHPLAGGRRPDRDVRPFQSVLLDLGHRLRLPGMAEPDGSPTYPDYADYMVRHQRRPGVGPLAGWRGDGDGRGPRRPQPGPARPLHRERRLLVRPRPRGGRLLQALERRLPGLGRRAPASSTARSPSSSSSTPSRSPASRPPPSARATASRPTPCATPSPAPWRRCRSGIRRPADAGIDPQAFPLHAITQRPAAMYHSWGSQNAWLRQIHGENPLYVPGPVWDALGFEAGDWADVVSPHARITVPVARMDAQNPLTVWTWNAIGKRPGAWALDPRSPEATRGFLLNHLIPERLPRTAPPTPTRSPARPPGTTSASASSASPPEPAQRPAFPPQASPPGPVTAPQASPASTANFRR